MVSKRPSFAFEKVRSFITQVRATFWQAAPVPLHYMPQDHTVVSCFPSFSFSCQVSDTAKDFVSKLLVTDPANRMDTHMVCSLCGAVGV